MRILGIDPGFGTIGFGIIEKTNSAISVVDYGVISTPKEMEFAERLSVVADSIKGLISTHAPDEIAIEQLFFSANISTGIPVAQARGVILLECFRSGKPTYEYNPLHIKQAITGQARAQKTQMQQMVALILGLAKPPRPDDAADALAIAITHAQTNQTLKG